jgi:hypothetical protein
MGKKSGSGMNIPDHISESLETIFGLNSLIRIRNLFDLGSGIPDGKIRIRDKHPGSQHWMHVRDMTCMTGILTCMTGILTCMTVMLTEGKRSSDAGQGYRHA